MKLPTLKKVMRVPLASVLVALLTVAQSEAATVVGSSFLLNSSRANQLESWLGEGSLTLTNIYTSAIGHTATNFHSAVDGGGRTFVVMSAAENSGFSPFNIIGGYNPQSWSSTGGYNLTSSDAERTAFIFNLSTTSLFRQNLTSELLSGTYDAGVYQTYNLSSYGPTFGGGHDIFVGTNLNSGYSHLFSYSDSGNIFHSIVDGSPYDGANVVFGSIEVFSISTTAPIPEPETYAMLLAGLGLLGFAARRRKLREAAAA